jgi:hypothetical protein
MEEGGERKGNVGWMMDGHDEHIENCQDMDGSGRKAVPGRKHTAYGVTHRVDRRKGN